MQDSGADRKQNRPLTFIVLGASGDLAQKKLFPALFALFGQKLLPAGCKFVGFARTNFTDVSFRERIAQDLVCRYVPSESCDEWTGRFLENCFYVEGHYDDVESFQRLAGRLAELEGGRQSDRLFYFAVPPMIFPKAAAVLAAASLAREAEKHDGAWHRIVLEKPFGRDRLSSDALTGQIHELFLPRQIYRIDHYLGKAVIQNLLVLRFANLVFEPIWNRNYVDYVSIIWKEDVGVGSRAGYFDQYGIARDVLQNHLFQILALVAMEPPVRLEPQFVIEEKVKALRSILPIKLQDIVLGQYQGRSTADAYFPAYREEMGVPKDSVSPTFAAAVLNIRNRRWDGVPFFISAGKALDARTTEIHVRFKPVPGGLFCPEQGCLAPNELVIRVQPNEAILLDIVTMEPGLSVKLAPAQLDLRYEQAFNRLIPDAYERLLLDVIAGDKTLFISSDELSASWDILDPVLKASDANEILLEPYQFGSKGPARVEELLKRFGINFENSILPRLQPGQK